MAGTSNTALRVTELDFDNIKTNLKDFLRSQSEFQDYDFEGSGMSVLLDILAYNTHYMGYYLNMVSNEMFLDTAQLRGSILSHAKAIGYIPRSRIGAEALVNIKVTPSGAESNSATSLTMDKYTRFLGEDIDGVNYPFVAINANTVSKSGGSFNFSNVVIKQGEVVTNQYIMEATNTQRRFSIPSANVDLDTVSIVVQESSANTYKTSYTISTDITQLDSNSTAYFIEENDNSQYTFYFGDDVIGKKPKIGNVILCTYLDTFGAPANNISKFAPTDRIGGVYRDNVVITAVTSSYGASDKETIEQVRFRAPHSYTTQNRAVIKSDYENIITRDFSNIDSVSVWGGEDNEPVVYGKVYISIKPKQNYALTNVDKEYIKDQLIRTRNIMTVTPEIVDPDYTYVRIIGNVTYNPSLTTLKASQLESLVRAAILDYNDREMNNFDSTFRKSKLQAYIEASETSITGSDLTVFMQKRVNLKTSISAGYSINYNMPISKGTYLNRIYSFPEIYAYDTNNNEQTVLFEEVLNSASGINSFDVTNPGFGYDSDATVTITGDGYGATATATIINGRINSINIVNKGTDYTRATVTISGDGSEAVIVPKLESNYGTIRTFYYTATGEKVEINPTAGSINYETGLLSINSIYTTGAIDNDFYNNDVLTFFAPIQKDIISPKRNRILNIDENDAKSIQINMVAEQ
jgi:hypothetical protein